MIHLFDNHYVLFSLLCDDSFFMLLTNMLLLLWIITSLLVPFYIRSSLVVLIYMFASMCIW